MTEERRRRQEEAASAAAAKAEVERRRLSELQERVQAAQDKLFSLQAQLPRCSYMPVMHCFVAKELPHLFAEIWFYSMSSWSKELSSEGVR